jgi:hypothetical protein
MNNSDKLQQQPAGNVGREANIECGRKAAGKGGPGQGITGLMERSNNVGKYTLQYWSEQQTILKLIIK